jgi:hypothetical protein
VLRSGDVESPDVLLDNLASIPVLYVKGADDGAPGDLGTLTDLDVPGAAVQVLEEAGSALAPSEETQTAFQEWVGMRHRDVAPKAFDFKLGDVRFGSINWCTASVINRRVTAKPSDADFPRIHVEVDAGANTINVETVNVLEMYVYLSDAVVNLDKPVTIKVNGDERVKRKMFNRSLRHLLETRFYNNSGDYGLYTASVRIEQIDANVPGS